MRLEERKLLLFHDGIKPIGTKWKLFQILSHVSLFDFFSHLSVVRQRNKRDLSKRKQLSVRMTSNELPPTKWLQNWRHQLWTLKVFEQTLPELTIELESFLWWYSYCLLIIQSHWKELRRNPTDLPDFGLQVSGDENVASCQITMNNILSAQVNHSLSYSHSTFDVNQKGKAYISTSWSELRFGCRWRKPKRLPSEQYSNTK